MPVIVALGQPRDHAATTAGSSDARPTRSSEDYPEPTDCPGAVWTR